MSIQKTRSRILLVEDNPVTMMSLSLFFKNSKYEVAQELAYAEEVSQQVKDLNPDILVMDIMLKGSMDGLGAAKEIREFSDIPILFVSALTDKVTLSKLTEVTNAGFIAKPYDYEQLEAKIDSLIKKNS